MTWDSTTVSDDSYMITAVARDGAGNSTHSNGVLVTVNNTTPVRSTETSTGTIIVGTTSSIIPFGCTSGTLFSPLTGGRCTALVQTPLIKNVTVKNGLYVFKRNLSKGLTGEDVRQLQVYLNTHGYTVASVGAGSPGKETVIFGSATKAALIKLQKAHNITPVTGTFGPLTMKEINTKAMSQK